MTLLVYQDFSASFSDSCQLLCLERKIKKSNSDESETSIKMAMELQTRRSRAKERERRKAHLATELGPLLLQLGQPQAQLGAALQLLLPQGLGVLGRVGQQALPLSLGGGHTEGGRERERAG